MPGNSATTCRHFSELAEISGSLFESATIGVICGFNGCAKATTCNLVAHFFNFAISRQVGWVFPEQGLDLPRFGPLVVVAEHGVV